MEDKLYERQIEGVNEVRIIDFPKKEVPKQEFKPLPKQEDIIKDSDILSEEKKKEELEKWNNNEKVKKNRIIAIPKGFLKGLKIFCIILGILFILSNLFWFNYTFMNKDFSPKVENNLQNNITTNIEPADVSITPQFNNSYIINNYINNTIILTNSTI